MPRGGKREWAGRGLKYGEPMVHRSIKLPETLNATIKAEAGLYGVSVNEIIVGNLNKALTES